MIYSLLSWSTCLPYFNPHHPEFLVHLNTAVLNETDIISPLILVIRSHVSVRQGRPVGVMYPSRSHYCRILESFLTVII